MTITEYVPSWLKLTESVAVREVAPPEVKVRLVGEMLAVTCVDDGVNVKLTVPVKPSSAVTVIIEVPVAPAF